jgi:accessory gene regulator protein AgrB
MGCYKIVLVTIVSFLLLVQNTKGWGDDGHVIVCKIAQVSNLLLACVVFQNFELQFVNSGHPVFSFNCTIVKIKFKFGFGLSDLN